MIEIGIFIKPNKSLEDEIILWKNKFHNKFGNQLFLDHIPHLTLSNFFVTNVNDLLIEIRKYCQNFNNQLSIEINKTSQFDIENETKTINLHYEVIKNKKLLNFQENLSKKISPYIISKFQNNFIYNKYNFLNETFGYPFIGKYWIPHFTICSLEEIHQEDGLKDEFLELKLQHKFYVENIEIYEIKDSSHLKIEEIGING